MELKWNIFILTASEFVGWPFEESGDLDSDSDAIVLPDPDVQVAAAYGTVIGWKLVTRNMNPVHLSFWEHENGTYV